LLFEGFPVEQRLGQLRQGGVGIGGVQFNAPRAGYHFKEAEIMSLEGVE